MFVFKAAVVGAGTIGGEIAHTIASADIPVVLKDVDAGLVQSGLEHARALWQSRVDAGKMESGELERSLARITGTTAYDEFGDVELVIEATAEQIEAGRALFAELDEVTGGHAILASSASALSITELGEATSRPDKVVGLHFLQPASVVRLVEVIEGEDTSPETVQAASNFAQTIRKTPIRASDTPGFVVNRIMGAAVSELWRYQEDNGIPVEALDRAIVESKAAPVGPFLRADVLGLDLAMRLTAQLRDSYGDRFHVHGQLRDLVEAGDLGAKTGKGFYEHRD
jgi:3-hydroxyacyl-CoA dehydrogenase